MTLTLRPYQQEAVDGINAYWEEGVGKDPLVIAPTGSGKSIIIADFAKKTCLESKRVRIIVVTDSRDLVAQNEKQMRNYWMEASTGIYSAGLGKRQTQAQITFAGIQSIYNHAFDLGKIDIICVDECFPHDTEIITNKGAIKIGYIVEKNLDVLVLTHSGQYKRIVGRFKKPVPSTMVCVIHEKGKVESTTNHLFLTKRGWIKAEDLIVGDYIYNVNVTQYPRTSEQGIESKMGKSNTGAAPHQCYGISRKEECVFAQDIDQRESGSDYLGKLDGGHGNQLPEQIQQLSKTDNSPQFEAVRVCRLEICHASEPLCKSPEAGKERGIWRHELLFHNKIPAMFDRLFQFSKDGWTNKIYSRLVNAYNRSGCYSSLVFGRWFNNARGTEHQHIDGSCYTRGGGVDSRLVVSGMGNGVKNISFQKGIEGGNIQKGRCCYDGENIEGVKICTPDIDVQSSVYDIEIEDDHTYTANGIVVHNCHMISRKSQTRYGKFLKDMKTANPRVVCVGFSATPYRLDSGMLHEGDDAMFDGIAYVCEMKQLIKEGYLVPVISKGGVIKIDLSGVHIRAGDYAAGELAHAADDPQLVKLAVQEIVTYGQDRNAWLVFASGVTHANHVAEEIEKHGIKCEVVTGETPNDERDRTINKFKTGKLRCLVNVAVFTKGFDAPICDMIALLTSTKSTGKYVQIVGRGMRPYPDKENCLLLDFGGNVIEHGPIDEVDPVKRKNIFCVEPKKPPMKECPECRCIIFARTVVCPGCGYEFPMEARHGTESFDGAVMSDQQKPFIVEVKDHWYGRHKKHGKPDSMKMAFYDNLGREFAYWVTLDHTGYAAEKAQAIVKQFGGKSKTVDEALKEQFDWRTVTHIKVQPRGKFFSIIGFVFKAGESQQQKLEKERV